MTETEIRAMDGPALTRLAFRLGLAPQGVGWKESWWPQVSGPCWGNTDVLSPSSHPWQPHVDLVQADAVFRRLRRDRFVTELRGDDQQGTCLAIPKRHAATTFQTWWVLPTDGESDRDPLIDTTEALALTRCAVLARAQVMQMRIAADAADSSAPAAAAAAPPARRI